MARIERITPGGAAGMLRDGGQDFGPDDHEKLATYRGAFAGGMWQAGAERDPITVTPHGKVKDGRHRLLAVVAFGAPVDLLVEREIVDG